jgi:hypothetical protein
MADKFNPTAVLASILGIALIALLSGVGWIIAKVVEMAPTVALTAQRVDRIVEVLPEVKVRIAREELQRQIVLAVVTTEPFQQSIDRWVRQVSVIDYEAGKQKVFQIHVKGPDDLIGGYAVSGLAQGIARDKVSFEEFAAAAAELGIAKQYPLDIDPALSFAVVKTKPTYERQIISALGEPVRQKDITRKRIIWEQMVDELLGKNEPK